MTFTPSSPASYTTSLKYTANENYLSDHLNDCFKFKKKHKMGIIRRWPSNYSLGFFSKSLDNTMDIWYFLSLDHFCLSVDCYPLCLCSYSAPFHFSILFICFQGASRQNFGAWTSKLHQLIIWKLSTFFYNSFNLKWVNQYAKCMK